MYVPDNYDFYLTREAEEERWLESRPKCEKCGEPIQEDDLFDIDGVIYCEECMHDLFKKKTENYVRGCM